GTRTIVLISPGLDLFAVSYALFRIGAIPVMIDPGMGTRRMVKALESVQAEAFVGIPRSQLLRFLFAGAFKSIRTWISTGACWSGRAYSLRRMPYAGVRPEAVPVNRNAAAALFFTSGSTGAPKGVIYTSGMLEAQIGYLKNSFRYNPDEVDLCTFPLIGLLLICMGISIVLADMDMTHPSNLNPRRILKNISDYQCTHMFCSPMVLKRLADYGKEQKDCLGSMKRIMTAGAPVLPSVLKEFVALLSEDAEIHTPYGATEALPLTDISHIELMDLDGDSENFMKGTCVGYPLEGIEMKIMPVSEHPVASMNKVTFLKENEVGEIVIRGPNVSEAYWMNEKANGLAKIYDVDTRNTWHRTGDLGRIDPEGRLWFYGRKSHRVISGGKVYFTIPVEAVFNRHPAVSRSALVGVRKQDRDDKIPVICIELVENKKRKIYLYEELRSMASENEMTGDIDKFLFHRKFPVDPRHNAKIFREKLADWATVKMKL
ncbi:MAG: fatty acid CoA ligase family protein, partial [Bacteroidota bacterium]